MADGSSFIYACVLDRQGGGRVVDTTTVESWSPDDGLLWLHLDVTNPRSRQWVNAQRDIDEVTREALLAGETRPRVVNDENGMLLVLRGVNMNPGADPEDMVAIRVWVETDRILTCQRRALLSIRDIREAIESGRGPATTGEFVENLVGRLADRIGNVVDEIEDKLNTAEEQAAAADAGDLRLKIGELRRQTAAIRRYLAPQRDALDRMNRQSSRLLSAAETDALREEADRITRYLEDLDLARERAMVLQEGLASRLANEQNSRMYLLSVVAAVFLPLTFVTGLLGMNVAGLPGTQNPAAFIFALALMGVLGLLLVVLFKWKKWI